MWVVTGSRSAPGVGIPCWPSARMTSANSAERGLHQDEDVLGTHPSAARTKRTAAVQPAFDLGRDPGGELARRAAQPFDRFQRPGLGIDLGARLLHRRPQRHLPARLGPCGEVADLLVEGQHRPLQPRIVEHPVDGRKDARKRAEARVQRQLGERAVDFECGKPELPTRPAEQGRIGPLERIDRLLLVADREQGAGPLHGAVAAEEFGGQLADHPPLFGIGVLAFVDEDVGDARIELVAHPGRLLAMGKQVAELVDQVVEIEPGMGPLLRLVALDDGAQQIEQRFGALDEGGATENG